MSKPVIVRPMRPGDLDRVMEIAASLKDAPQWSENAYRAALHPPNLDAPNPDPSNLDPANPVPRVALVAEDKDRGAVAGFAVASVVPPETELETIAVARDAQGHGIGTRLLAALVEGLRAGGLESMHLEVRAGNAAALGLYRSLGFVETGRRARYYASPVEDAILMALRLD